MYDSLLAGYRKARPYKTQRQSQDEVSLVWKELKTNDKNFEQLQNLVKTKKDEYKALEYKRRDRSYSIGQQLL